jgi:hypothetical protein
MSESSGMPEKCLKLVAKIKKRARRVVKFERKKGQQMHLD